MTLRKQIILLIIFFSTIVALLSILIIVNRVDPPEGVSFSREEALVLIKEADSGNAEACLCVRLYYEEDHDRLSWEYTRKAAVLGNAGAQYLWAGHTGSRDWLIKAAENNEPWAQTELGEYFSGQSDVANALYWYRRSALQGNVPGIQSLISMLTEQSKGRKEWLVEAYAWTIIGLS